MSNESLQTLQTGNYYKRSNASNVPMGLKNVKFQTAATSGSVLGFETAIESVPRVLNTRK